MKEFNNIVNKFFSNNYVFTSIDIENDFYSFYLDAKNSGFDLINYDYIVKALNSSNLTEIYLNTIKEYNDELITQIGIHGMSHIIRTSLFLLIISVLERINEKDFKLLLESILYHDVGRVNDIDDEMHGFNSTKKISFLKEYYSQEDYNMICALITAHCLDDKLYTEVSKYYSIKDDKHFYKLLSIIKDSDALDRVRDYPYVDKKFLRTHSSKQLLSFAYEFYNSYEINK